MTNQPNDKRERELMAALAQTMVNKFHCEYPEGTQPGDATRIAMGYLNLLASLSAVVQHNSPAGHEENRAETDPGAKNSADTYREPHAPASSEGRQEPKHVCGLQGFNPMIDECPACSARERERAVAPASSEQPISHAVTCKLFPDPYDEREPAGPCTCGASAEPKVCRSAGPNGEGKCRLWCGLNYCTPASVVAPSASRATVACPHTWTRPEPQPAKFTCSCGAVVYRSREDAVDD